MMVPFENEETVKHMYVLNGCVRVPFWPQVSPYRVLLSCAMELDDESPLYVGDEDTGGGPICLDEEEPESLQELADRVS